MREEIGDESVFLRVSEFKKGLIQFTDSTNAMRLVKENGRDIRYNAAWKKWVVWNGKYWEMDEGGCMIHEKGLEMVRNIYDELLKTADYRERIDIEKAAMMSESVRRRKAFVEAATWISALRIRTDELDVNPWLLNVKNGTIDILSGEFREHRQEDLITKIANVEYDPKADCPKWKQFVREVMDYKTDLIKFVQTAVGWSMSGDISEQTMFILYGTGANGKSTFLNTIMYLLGDYSIATPTETFMKKSGDNYSNDVARLRGTRFVSTTEVEQGRRLSEPLIKKITGNDEMTARFLYGEFFNFAPTFKIFMATNHKPVIKGTDHGIWRRIKLIPFTTRIPEDKQDKFLEMKLREEASGILNWLLEGAANWNKNKLKAPKAVLFATDEYRGEMDVIGNFIRERCTQEKENIISIKKLYKAYSDWCEEKNEHPVSERFFTLRLKENGFQQGRTATERFWTGIGLIN
ncbi:DNA primase family protein [Treponema sp. R80B11-R83G3]